MNALRKAGWMTFATLLLAGCAEKLTYDRWQTIYVGQSQDGVEETLGDPTEKLEMRWMYHDNDRCINADIYFQDCKVIGKTWSDPRHGMQGKSPLVNQPGDADVHKYRKTE